MTPNAQLQILPTSGHLPWLDAPREVATLAIEFLRAELEDKAEQPRPVNNTGA